MLIYASKFSLFVKNLISIFLFCLLSGLSNANAANYPLEIIQPQANLDVKNRFYKAYPGLEYNVRLAVIGGEYPYQFELVTSPEGMSIDQKGEIIWVNPVESVEPYEVRVKVLDSGLSASEVVWSITVTTNGFKFIDAINGTSVGSGGDGSLLNPWKSLKDMYEGDQPSAKSLKRYAGEFLYWREGNHVLDAYAESNGGRIPFVYNNKPLVWLAYPGENVSLDLANAYISIYSGGSNTYFDGFEINVNGTRAGKGIVIDSAASNVTFRRIKAHGISNGYTGGNNALFFIARAGVGVNWSFQDNELYNVNSGYGLLGYDAAKVLVEDNTLYSIAGHPIGPKMSTDMWFIRSNYMHSNPQNSINVQYYRNSAAVSGNIEISYNYVAPGGGKVRINSQQESVGNPMYMFRNTFLDEVQQDRVSSTNGGFYWYGNVIVNGSSSNDKIDRFRIDDPSRLLVTNSLTGSPADNIVDADGFLQADFSENIGSIGHQVGMRPLEPTFLVVN